MNYVQRQGDYSGFTVTLAAIPLPRASWHPSTSSIIGPWKGAEDIFRISLPLRRFSDSKRLINPRPPLISIMIAFWPFSSWFRMVMIMPQIILGKPNFLLG